MVSALQALGITSAAPRWAASVSKHPDNLVEVLLLCRIFIASKQLSRGEPFLRLLEDIFPTKVTSDPVYPSHVMATLLSCVGEVMDQYNRPDKAGEYFDEYLRITEKHFSAQSVVYGDALTIVCGFNLRRNKFDLALIQASEALAIRKSSLKAPHARLADAYNNRGIVLKALGKNDEAVGDFKECAQQRIKLFGASSIPVGDVFYALGTLLDTVEAEKYLSACHSIRLKILGPSHPDSLAVASALKQYKKSHKENDQPAELQKVEPPVEANPPVVRPVMSKSGSKSLSPTDDRMVKILSPVDTSSFRHPSLKPMTITREQDKLEPPRTDGLEAKPVSVKESILLSPESPGGKSLRQSVSAVVLSSGEPSPRLARPNSEMWTTSRPVSPSSQLRLPESPFKQNEDLVGTSEFLEHLLSLDPYMIGTCDFSIQAALPKKVSAFWIPIAMKAIYAKRVIMEEIGPESDGAMIEDFLGSLKKSETEVRLVFHLLNSVSENLKNQALKRSASSFGKMKPSLSTSNFVAFLTSRTQNVALMEYFTKLLRQKQEETYQAVIKNLAGVKSISGVKAYLSKLKTVTKSMTHIDEDLSKLPSNAAGPSEAGQVVQQTLDMMPDIHKARKTIVSRSKNISQSIDLLADLFGMKRPIEEIDDAVKGLETLYDLLIQHADDRDESENESEEEEQSEHRSDEESAVNEPEDEQSEISESHDSELSNR
jgi:tetratricopeptide (TPR) repeat protein